MLSHPTAYDTFATALRCPRCGWEGGLKLQPTSLICPSCQREFTFQNGIADLGPESRVGSTLPQRLMETKFYARFYEDVMRPRLTEVVSDRTIHEEYALSADYLELSPACRLLDVACGTANFTRYFAGRVGPVRDAQGLLVGMDLSWPMLETARTYLRRDGLEEQVVLLRADGARIPIRSGAVDRLHCTGALHMMASPDEALREFARVLEPGGICVIGTVVLGRGLARRLVKRAAEVPTKLHWFRPRELYRRMERAGLEPVEESLRGDALTVKARRRRSQR